MKRRDFIQSFATTATGLAFLRAAHATSLDQQISGTAPAAASTEGHTLVSEFNLRGTQWKVYEDLRTRDGAFTFVSAGGEKRVMPKSAEAQFPGGEPQHLGLSMDEIGLSGPDLLADKLLANGDDPDPEMVKNAAPPQGSPPPPRPAPAPGQPVQQAPPQGRPRWDAFVGTKECFDTMPVFPSGTTRTYHPNQYFPEIAGDAV